MAFNYSGKKYRIKAKKATESNINDSETNFNIKYSGEKLHNNLIGKRKTNNTV